MLKKDVLVLRRELVHVAGGGPPVARPGARVAAALAALDPLLRRRALAALRSRHNDGLTNPSHQVPDLLGRLTASMELAADPDLDELDAACAGVIDRAARALAMVDGVVEGLRVDPRLRLAFAPDEAPRLLEQVLLARAATRLDTGAGLGPVDVEEGVESLLCRHAVVAAAGQVAARAEERGRARDRAVALGWREAAAVVGNAFTEIAPRAVPSPRPGEPGELDAAARAHAARLRVASDAQLRATLALAVVVQRRRRDAELRRRAVIDSHEVAVLRGRDDDVIDLRDVHAARDRGAPPTRHETVDALRLQADRSNPAEREVLEALAYVHDVTSHAHEWFAAAHPPAGAPGPLSLLWSISMALTPEVVEPPPGRATPTAAQRKRISRLADALARGPGR
jgi:hypothetical protein